MVKIYDIHTSPTKDAISLRKYFDRKDKRTCRIVITSILASTLNIKWNLKRIANEFIRFEMWAAPFLPFILAISYAFHRHVNKFILTWLHCIRLEYFKVKVCSTRKKANTCTENSCRPEKVHWRVPLSFQCWIFCFLWPSV